MNNMTNTMQVMGKKGKNTGKIIQIKFSESNCVHT